MTLVIGHRGSSFDHPENTVAAFRGALAQGSDWVELDVHLAADGTLAVVHDARLPDGRLVADLGRADLPPEVPTLAEALESSGTMGVNVEIKHGEHEPGFRPDRAIADAVIAELERVGHPEVLISSFDLGVIDRCQVLAPRIETAYLVLDVSQPLDALEAAVAGGHRWVHPWDATVTEDTIAAAHSAGLGVNVWTVDDPARIRQLADWGVDGVVTNRPAVALNVLGRH